VQVAVRRSRVEGGHLAEEGAVAKAGHLLLAVQAVRRDPHLALGDDEEFAAGLVLAAE